MPRKSCLAGFEGSDNRPFAYVLESQYPPGRGRSPILFGSLVVLESRWRWPFRPGITRDNLPVEQSIKIDFVCRPHFTPYLLLLSRLTLTKIGAGRRTPDVKEFQ